MKLLLQTDFFYVSVSSLSKNFLFPLFLLYKNFNKSKKKFPIKTPAN